MKAEMEDFYPIFIPVYINAEVCKLCGERGMPKWEKSSTARMCSNCKYVEEKNSK